MGHSLWRRDRHGSIGLDRMAVRRSIDGMRLAIRSGSSTTEACDALIVLAAGDKGLSGPAAAVDAATNGALAAVLALGDFDGIAGSTRLVHVGDGLTAQRVLLVGTGDGGGDPAEGGRLAGGAAIQGVCGMTIRTAVVVLPERADAAFVQGLTEGLALASYRFDRHRTTEETETAVESVTLLAATEEDARALQAAFDRAVILSEATGLARDLVNEPPNHLTPTALADRAVDVAGAHGLRSRVLGPVELSDQGFGALLGVAQGSAEEPRFIVLEHAGEDTDAAPLVLVGKGLTFDSGGLSIKTGKGRGLPEAVRELPVGAPGHRRHRLGRQGRELPPEPRNRLRRPPVRGAGGRLGYLTPRGGLDRMEDRSMRADMKKMALRTDLEKTEAKMMGEMSKLTHRLTVRLGGAIGAGAGILVAVLALAACATEPPPCPPHCAGADLRGADLRGSDLRGADLNGADLTAADLRGAILSGADLSQAKLRRATLARALLIAVDLSGTDLTEADLTGAVLTRADLTGSVLIDVQGCDATGRLPGCTGGEPAPGGS